VLALTSALLLLIGQATSIALKPEGPPVLQVGIFSYGPDGQPQGSALTSLSSESFQYVGLGCEIGAGNRPVPDRSTDAWRVSGNVERMTDDEAVVQIDWQRVRAGGRTVTAPGGSVHLTLHPGDRVPLDSATTEPTALCAARTIGFEARFAPRAGWVRVPRRGAANESSSVTIVRGGGSGGGVGSGTGAGAGASASGGGGRARRPASANDSKELTAELWLVRKDAASEKPEFNLQGLVIDKLRGVIPFSFSSFSIDTPSGPLTVQISGSVQVTNERGPAELVFTASRNVRYASSTPTRDATSTSSGSSTTRNPMPGPDEVLSFELPPIRVPNSTATLPDQYSVRLRIR
jgi:hypothetical protein